MRTLLWFIGAAAIAMALAGMIALHPNIVYFGMIAMGVVSILIGFRSPEEL
jgi:uncharacterized membrane protein